MAVDPKKVMELREKTGLPMMECKKALEKTGGEVEKAFEELRKAGLKAQEKLAGRAANEGRVGSHVSPDGRVGALVTLRCETEPVGKNEHFQKFLAELVEVVARQAPRDAAQLSQLKLPSGPTVASGLTELVNKIRENISLGRFARFEADAIGQYVHFDQKKAAMLAFKGGSTSNPKVVTVGKEIGMHLVFAHLPNSSKPVSVSRATLDQVMIQRDVEKEREIYLAAVKSDPKNAKKPEEILKKIVEGQVEQFIASKCLLEQPFSRDPKQSVGSYLKSSGALVTIEDFVYVAVDQS
jgi:elongation factor Ts